MCTQVDPHTVRPQRFSEPWVSYSGIHTTSPVPELPRRASTSAVPSSVPRRSGSRMQPVPHRPYPPPHSKTKGQYVDDATLQLPILFDLIGSSTQRGIAAKDAMNKRYHNIVGRDDPMFEESGSSVALRFEVSFFAMCLLCRLTRLVVARLQVLESPSTLSIRLLDLEWKIHLPLQIKTNDWRKTRRPITRAKLATDICKSLSLFIQVCRPPRLPHEYPS